MAAMQSGAGDRPKVALFRAREDAARSAEALAAIGFDAVVLPVIETRALAFTPSRPRYDAVLATSAKAFLADAPVDRSAPLYGVGERTAQAAIAAGWRLAAPPAPDADSLAALIRARVAPGATLLYLAGRDRKPGLEQALAGAYALEVVEAYAAEARAAFRPDEAEALGGCQAALHYSPRSAGLAATLAERGGAGAAFRRLVHVALSRDVAEALEAAGLFVRVAKTPTEPSLFVALERALGRVPFG